MHLSVTVVSVGHIRILCGGLKLACNGNGGSGGGTSSKRHRLYHSAFVKTPLIRLSSKLHVVPAQSENMNMVHSWGPIVGTISTIYENVQLSVWDIDILPGTSGNKYVGRLIGRFSFSSY